VPLITPPPTMAAEQIKTISTMSGLRSMGIGCTVCFSC
jgi:hypothetical protein